MNEVVEWILLTNGAQWQVYHLSGGLPLVTDLALDVDLLSEDQIGRKVDTLFYLSKEAVKRGKLAELWQAKRATSPNSLAAILLTPVVIESVRKQLKKQTGYSVDASEVKRLLQETCIRSECFER